MRATDTFYSFDRPYPEHYPLPHFVHIGRLATENPWHYAPHEEPGFEWFLMEEGSVHVTIDGIPYDVHAGDLYVVQPGQMQHERGTGYPLAFMYLKFVLYDFSGQPIDLFPRDGSIEPVARGVLDELAPHFRRILAEVTEARLGCEQIVEAIVLQLIWLLRRKLSLPVAEGVSERVRHPRLVERVNAYIRTRLDQKVTLPQLAAHCAMSTAHFGHVFKERTGLSPMQYLLQARMDYALILMNRHPDWSLAQVAAKVGFLDALYFSRQFKKVYGFPPSQARDQTPRREENLASVYPDLYDPPGGLQTLPSDAKVR